MKIPTDFNFKSSTLIKLLRHRAENQPNREAFIFLPDGESEEGRITFQQLDSLAQTIGAFLQSRNLRGERTLLLYQPGLDYVAAFWGCLYAGVIAVPAYPPRNNRNLPRLQAIIKDAQAKVALTSKSLVDKIRAMFFNYDGLEDVEILTTDGLDETVSGDWIYPNITSHDISFLQYTSGSTGTPKGVMLSHQNLLYNLELIKQSFQITPDNVGVIWLPPYHDMGLIGGILEPIYGITTTVLMPPPSFLQRPIRWLEAIHRYKGSVSGGPNFAYELCADKITPEQCENFDLSSWKVAFNGAEPVRADTIERFTKLFSPYGFRKKAFYPCYGLAEATLFVTSRPHEADPFIKEFDKSELEKHRAKPLSEDVKDATTLVGCGISFGVQTIKIVNPETLKECAPDEVGEIWVTGPSIAQGYWNKEEESKKIFYAHLPQFGEERFLRTEDLGFIYDGQLFVTGRIKDLIIIRGVNHYPQDIERTVEKSHPSFRLGGAAAFSIDAEGEERLVIAQELDFRQKPDTAEVVAAVRQAVAEEHDLQIYAIALVKPGRIPKTSSGKIQRYACREGFLHGTLDTIAEWRAEISDEKPQADLAAEEEKTTAEPDGPDSHRNYIEIRDWLIDKISSQLKVAKADIDVKQPFARYGLDSLQSMSLAGDLQSWSGISLTPTIVYEYPTINELAEFISRSTNLNQADLEEAVLHSKTRQDLYPLSFAQRRMWFLNKLHPEDGLYNNTGAVVLKGSLDILAFEKALQQIVNRHEILRTIFLEQGGEPYQKILQDLNLILEKIDLVDVPENDKQIQIDKIMKTHSQHSFNLQFGPLLRTTLIFLNEHNNIFLLTMHHIISDGWSFGIFVKELEVLYEANRSKKSPSLSKLPIQYVDLTLWQRKWLNKPNIIQQKSFWKKQLQGAISKLNLPTDKPRLKALSHQGASYIFKIQGGLVSKLTEIGNNTNATLFMVLLSAFYALLFRYTGEDDLCIGVPIANRMKKETKNLIGFFVNTLVLRARIKENLTFRRLLQNVRQLALAAYANQDIPFEMLVEELHPERDFDSTPFFQVMFAMQNAPLPKLQLKDLIIERIDVAPCTAKFDLTLEVEPVDDYLLSKIIYNSNLFKSSTIVQLVEDYLMILEDISIDANTKLSNLPISVDVQQYEGRIYTSTLSSKWEKTGQFIHELFQKQVAHTPDAIIKCKNEIISYKSLNEKANKLARYLQKFGIKTEEVIGIFMERSLQFIISILAVQKAGGIYLPLDPDYPNERISFLIKDSQAKIILTESKLPKRIRSHISKVVFIDIDKDSDEISRFPGNDLENNFSNQNISYMIYTSGSTGMPKGVLVPHNELAKHCLNMIEHYGLTTKDNVLQFASFNFDASLEQIFSALLSGANLFMRDNSIWTFQEFLKFVNENNLSVINLPTAYWYQILQEISEKQSIAISDYLRLVIIGGDKMTPEMISLWQHSPFNKVKLLNAYGPTEATITSTIFEIPKKFSNSSQYKNIPIGFPLPRREAYILDKFGNRVPMGVVGELYLGGLGLGRGYHNKPGLTSEKFVPDPFTRKPGSRLYRTGDLVRLLPDYGLEFVGRIDHQVKIRGFRIELGEIEEQLQQHSDIKECIVLPKEDITGDRKLVAYVTTLSNYDNEVIHNKLKRYLKSKLPNYMIPSFIVVLDSFPYLANGKINQQALPTLKEINIPSTEAYAEPRNPIETELANIFIQILDIEKIGIYDNFFDLGGHSLLAIKLISLISEKFQVQLPLKKVFESPTIAELALKIIQTQAENQDTESISQILEEIESLSDEEVQMIIEKEIKIEF